MPSAVVNNCRIEYELQGEGPTVVFIHGESHGIEMFEYQMPFFSKTHRCLAYYRRGHGKSDLPRFGYSLWNQAQDLKSLLDHLGFERVILVAVAMSTTVAATFAISNPQRVRALVMASWYELDGYPILEERRKKHAVSFSELHLLMERILLNEGRDALEAFLEANYEAYFPIFPRDPAARRKIVTMFASHPVGHYVESAEFYTSIPHLIPQMGVLQCPVMGICGSDDPSPDRPELLKHLANFRQEWIEGARRFTMIEQPETFNRTLASFLATVPP